MNSSFSSLLMSLIALVVMDDLAPEVEIEQGVLVGKVNKEGQFYEYLGIPYGVANSSNRFLAPFPAPSWSGVFKATEPGNQCPQLLSSLVIGDEDCLKINVYVPTKVERPIPVMVFIHGGGFVLGNGSPYIYGPQFILKKEVILVTFNYRLGPLGFLCLGIKEAPGNAGLKDQLAALRWVKKNIAAFGGDPDNITLFGESAGGASTSFMVASPATKGLFQKAIMQSGCAVADWPTNNKPIWTAEMLAKKFGYEGHDPMEIYRALSKLSTNELVGQVLVKPWNIYFETDLFYTPCIEKEFPGIEPFMTDLAYNTLVSSYDKNLTLMYGFNDHEGYFFVSIDTPEKLESRNQGYTFNDDLAFSSKREARRQSDKVNKYYFGNKRIGVETILNVSKLYTEAHFGVPSIIESKILLEKGNTVYNYYFKYDGDRNFIKWMAGYSDYPGATHGDELFYLFKSPLLSWWINGEDKKMINQITTLWTNFAKYGNPTPKPTAELPEIWEPSTKNDVKFFHIDKEMKMGPIPNIKSYYLWDEIYSKYRRTSRDYKRPATTY